MRALHALQWVGRGARSSSLQPCPSCHMMSKTARVVAAPWCRLHRTLCHCVRHSLPHGRPLVTSGAYRYVRHPMYLGETLMLIGCCITQTSWQAMLLVTLSLSAIALRIVVEESRLRVFNSRCFDDYASLVKWRLIPRVW